MFGKYHAVLLRVIRPICYRGIFLCKNIFYVRQEKQSGSVSRVYNCQETFTGKMLENPRKALHFIIILQKNVDHSSKRHF
jgi:hypothetical protein